MPLADPEDPPRQDVEDVDCHDPTVDVYDGLEVVVGQRAEVDLGVGLPDDVGRQGHEEHKTKPDEADEAGGQPVAVNGDATPRPRRLWYLRQVRVEGVGLEGGAVPLAVGEGVGFAGPPGGGEDALGLGEGVADADVALVEHED